MAAKKATGASSKKTATKRATTKARSPTKPATRKTATKKGGAWGTHPIIATAPGNLKVLAKLRGLCLALPATDEALS